MNNYQIKNNLLIYQQHQLVQVVQEVQPDQEGLLFPLEPVLERVQERVQERVRVDQEGLNDKEVKMFNVLQLHNRKLIAITRRTSQSRDQVTNCRWSKETRLISRPEEIDFRLISLLLVDLIGAVEVSHW